MSFGRIFMLVIAALVVAGVIYTGVWHLFTQFLWQHPTLSWLPFVALLVVGALVGAVRTLTGAGGTPLQAPSPQTGEPGSLGGSVETMAAQSERPVGPTGAGFRFAFGWGFLAGLAVLLLGLWFTLISRGGPRPRRDRVRGRRSPAAPDAAPAASPLGDPGRPRLP